MVEFLYENKELRNNDITTLNGYIENSKGEIVNLTIEKADKKILPNGKAVIYAYGEVPKSFESQRVNIYVGESVPSESEEELTNVMVNSVQFQHLVKETKPLDSVREFVFGQYDIKLTGILGILGSSDGFTPDKVDLNFDYNINLVDGAPEYVADQQLVFEYVDKNVKSVKFSKAFKLGGTDENSLQIGSSQTATISYTHPSLAYIGLGEFDLNVYHQYKGYKKLIATQTMDFGSN